MRLHRALIAAIAVAGLAACEKNAVQDITGPVPSARIRYFNFSINAPATHLYSGEQKVTASSSTSCQSAANPPVTRNDSLCHTTGIEANAGVAYGGVSTAGNYTGITPGQHTLVARLMTDAARPAVASVQTTIADGKAYSAYLTGFYNTTTRQADMFVVEDNFPTFDWSTAYVRFVNASPNAEPMTLYLTDIETGQTITVGGAVPFKSAGEFVKVPAAGYNLATRYTGSTQDRIVRANVGFEAGTVYTITARGDMTVTSTTAANRPFLDNTVNQ